MEAAFKSISISLKDELITDIEQETPIFWLPEEVHIHMLGFLEVEDLANAARINHYFNRIASDDLVWSRIHHLTLPDDFSRERIVYFVERCPELRRLSCKNCTEQLDDETTHHIVESLPHLTDIDFSNCTNISRDALKSILNLYRLQSVKLAHTQIDTEWFLSLLENCSRIKRCAELGNLDKIKKKYHSPTVEVLNLSYTGLAHTVVASFHKVFPNLKHLNIAGSFVDDATLQNSLPNLPNLESLNISNCSNISTISLSSAQIIPKLKQLYVNGCMNLSSLALNSAVLSTLDFQQCPGLVAVAFTLPLIEKLDFEHLENITTINLVCRALETLTLTGCPKIKDNALTQLISTCKHLKGLAVRKCAGITREGISSLTHLQHLELQELHNVDELVLESPTLISLSLIDVAFVEALLQCPALQKVTMDRSPKSDCALRHASKPAKGSRLFPMGDEWLPVLLANSPAITHLNLQDSPLTNPSLGAIVRQLQNLEYLDCSRCGNVTRAAIQHPKLNFLNLSNCGFLEALFLDCPALKSMKMEWCTKLIAVNINAPQLERLDKEGACTSVEEFIVKSDRLVSIDIKNWIKINKLEVLCPKLQSLTLSKCMNFTDETIQIILNLCSDLRTLNLSGLKGLTVLDVQHMVNLKSLELSELRGLASIKLKGCLMLESFQIAWCPKIKDSHIKEIIQATSLKTIKLRGMPGVTLLEVRSPTLEFLCLETSLHASSIYLDTPALFRLEIRGCASLKTAFVRASYVKVLDMDVCKKLESISFEALAHFSLSVAKRLEAVAPNLKLLSVKGSRKVGKQAIDLVLNNFKNLQSFVLEGCDLSEDTRLSKKPKLDIK